MQDLGLSPATERLSIQFMGCFGLISGLKAAKAFAREHKDNRVLLVCCELCSLHMQLDDRIDNLVATVLFSDGCGALVVGCSPKKEECVLFEVHRSMSTVIPNSLDMMAWELGSTGCRIGLSKAIPREIYRAVQPFAARLLRFGHHVKDMENEIDSSDCIWALHPGGPTILKAIIEACNITKEQTKASWEVLRNYGNMSSATLIFVLAEVSKNLRSESAWVPTLAFGPGLNVEGMLLKARKL